MQWLTTLHKYLYSHIRSSFLRIDAEAAIVFIYGTTIEKQQRLRCIVGVENLYEEYMVKRTFWRTCIVKLRMFYRDVRGHGKKWNYEQVIIIWAETN